jgi:lipid-A-disaccharide synthase
VNTPVKILVVAGEVSGDKHAADLVSELKKIIPQANFFGIGGDKMAAQSVKLLFHIKEMAVLGFIEIVRHLPYIRKVFRTLKSWLILEKPIAIILIDYPGFNLKLAKIAKKLEIPVIYYICPQIWAWGQNRIEKIRNYVDFPIVIFEFEKRFYADFNIDVQYVGHPLVEQIRLELSDTDLETKDNAYPGKDIIALLPGSRDNEVRKILPIMLKAFDLFDQNSNFQWIVCKSPTLPLKVYHDILSAYPMVKIIDKEIYSMIKSAKVAVVTSGTATLETGFLGTPMVVLYKVSHLTYYIGKVLVKIKNIALANIVLGGSVVPELIQFQATPAKIRDEINRYLMDSTYYNDVKKNLSRISKILGEPGAAIRAAKSIQSFLDSKTSDTENSIP